MNNYTDFDKQIIEGILEFDNYGFLITDIIQMIVPSSCFVKIWDDQEASERSGTKQFRFLVDKAYFLENRVSLLINLLNLDNLIEKLLDDGLIQRIDESSFAQIEINPESKKGVDQVWVMNDELRFGLFLKFHLRFQYNSDLIEFKNRSFQSSSELENKRNLILAIISTLIALASFILSLVAFFKP